jgi:apolipoprotein N-acyltransferase
LVLTGGFVAMIVLPFLYGKGEIARLEGTNRKTLTVAVLQGDIDSHHKWDSTYAHFSYATYYALSHMAADADIRRLREVQQLSRQMQAPLLIGTLEYKVLGPGQYIYHNAAHQVADGRLGPRFHAKLQLVPMGEWIPFSDRVKILQDIHVGQADFTAGNEYVVFAHRKAPYAALICFESAFPELVRNFVSRGAQFLVNITNDGWYGFTPGPYQHARMCVMRAIENRVPIARSANGGISMFVDRAGRMTEATDLFFTDLRVGTLSVGGATTFFTRHGMWVGWLCVWMTLAALTAGGILSFVGRSSRVDERKSNGNGKK